MWSIVNILIEVGISLLFFHIETFPEAKQKMHQYNRRLNVLLFGDTKVGKKLVPAHEADRIHLQSY